MDEIIGMIIKGRQEVGGKL